MASVRRFRFSQWCWWRFKSSATWCSLNWYMTTRMPPTWRLRRWRQQATSKRQWLFTIQHGVMSQKTWIFKELIYLQNRKEKR